MKDLFGKVRETIQKYNMFSPQDGVLVAVSGGPDSVALLHLLAGFKEEMGLRLEVAHLQHGIRGDEGRADALFVAGMAARMGLPCHLKDVDVPRIKSQGGGGNLEAIGREERYRFFAGLAEGRNIRKICTAHTRDDQVETLLMWLLRGSGRGGLRGMLPVRGMTPGASGSRAGAVLVRPLIESSRAEISAFLATRALEFRTDKTNLDQALLRNWIRLSLLPLIRGRFDPGLDERLAHVADVLREEEELLERITRDGLERALQGGALVRDSFVRLDKATQRRVLRLWFETALGEIKGFGFDHAEQALHFISQGPPQGRISVARGWELVKRYHTIRLEKRGKRQKASCSYRYSLPRVGELIIPEAGMRVRSGLVSYSSVVRPRDDSEAIFDPAVLPEELTVRNFRRGDRFHPLGMNGHKKLKDLFIEKRVPLEIRSTLPLFLAGDEILWIPNYGRSEWAKVGPQTRRVLRLRLEPHSG